MSNDVQSCLQAFYARNFPAMRGVRVSDVTSISAGWESDMYSFAVEYGPVGERQREQLILRVYPGDDAHDKSAHEFQGMSQLYKAGYPVPQVLVLEHEDSPLGQPFVIMEKIEGQVMWPLLFGSSGERQQELLTLFCGLFVQLHTLQWRPFVYAQDRPLVDDVSKYDTGDPYALVDHELVKWRLYHARFPQPGFLPILEWLEARRDQVPCLRPAPIHWDFHPGNVLLRDDDSAVVVDWTGLDISDLRFDLAWTLLLVSTYEAVEWRDLILQEYERLAGVEVEQLAYFDVAACARRLLSVVISLSEGPEKLGMRPAAAVMMKQQMGAIKRVYDLLLERTGIEVPEIDQLIASVA